MQSAANASLEPRADTVGGLREKQGVSILQTSVT